MAIEADAFLAACFRSTKEKIDVDFEKVAVETGMSAGGARYVSCRYMYQFADIVLITSQGTSIAR